MNDEKQNKVDVHILLHPEQPERQKNLKRVERKLLKVPFDVKLHKLQGVKDHIGQGRFEGFSMGQEPYVSFVDDDDDVEHKVFRKCIDILDNNPELDAVVTDEIHVVEGKVKKPLRMNLPRCGELYNLKTARYIHRLVVLRRESIEPYLDMLKELPTLCEFTVYVKMIQDGCKFVHLDDVGYYWFVHDKGSKSMKAHPSQTTIDMLKNMYQRD